MNPTIKLLWDMRENIEIKEHDMSYLYNLLIEIIGGLSTIGIDGKYIDINNKYANTCGYTPDELVGVEWVKTVHPDDIGVALQCYYDMIKNNKSELTFRGVKKDGTIFNKKIILAKKLSKDNVMEGHYCFMNEVF